MSQTGRPKVPYLGQDRIKPGQRPLGDRHIDGVEVGRKVRLQRPPHHVDLPRNRSWHHPCLNKLTPWESTATKESP